MPRQTRRFTVHGRVQGVWFRDSTRRQAQQLGLAGHAINLPDGNVEVLASGSPAALDKLQQWLHQGPPMARVIRVDVAAVDAEVGQGFQIG